jgi:glucan phosphoethanolaminetransferase (alkaline phosphatase superfamily)
MTIIKITPFTPTELAILEEKRKVILQETASWVLMYGLLLFIFAPMPGRHRAPSLYENFGIIGIVVIEILLCLCGIVVYFFKKSKTEKDIKSGLKTISKVVAQHKTTGLGHYNIFTHEDAPFNKFVVDKETYHKFCKGDIIIVEFAHFTQTIFDIKMPY